MSELKAVIEALIFASPEPLTVKTLVRLLDGETKDDIVARHRRAQGAVRPAWRPAASSRSPAGCQIVTRPELHEWVRRLFHRAHDAEAVGRLARDAGGHRLQAAGHRTRDSRDPRRQHRAAVVGTLMERKLVKSWAASRSSAVRSSTSTTREFLGPFRPERSLRFAEGGGHVRTCSASSCPQWLHEPAPQTGRCRSKKTIPSPSARRLIGWS